MKKNCKIHIPVSSEEKEKLKRRAEACGYTLATYCRVVLINAKPRIQVEEIID